jgi:hypothetical protein
MDAVYIALVFGLSVLLLIGCVVLYALVRYVIPRVRGKGKRVDRRSAPG